MVYIKKMICTGFKSFRRKTVVNFDRGFTAIVGANGSGKSNIIDAFVFVLGALSAKTLRAKNIRDLISNGGHGMGPAEVASVEIIFDNSDNVFGLDGVDLCVLRKVDRKGNGVYKINGKRSTRKEIINRLDLAGILPNSSNLILQGELFRLINMNDKERRELIEEIAGISSYNDRKETAEGELFKVQTNLGQIALVLNEVHGQLEQLKQEKADAETYLELVEREEIHKNAFYVVKQHSARQKIEEMASEQTTLDERINQIHLQETDLKTTISELQQKLEELAPKILAVQDSELLQMTNKRKKIKDRITELKTSHKYSTQNLTTYESEQKGLRERILNFNTQESQVKTEIAETEVQKIAMEQAIDLNTQRIAKLDFQLREIDSQYIQIKEQAKALRSEITAISDNKNARQTSLKVVEQDILNLSQHKSKIENRIFQNNELYQQTKQKLSELKQERKAKLGLEDLEDVSKSGIEQRIAEIERETVSLQKQRHQIKPRVLQKQKEIFEVKSKINVFQQVHSESRAIKALKQAQSKGALQGIHGTIADLGSTDPKYGTAFEMAAGNRFNFVVVDDSKVGEKCINYLKQNRLGRASFIPLDDIRYRSFTDKLPQNPKIYGRAVDLITFDLQYRDAFEYIFGRTIIVDDLSTARHLQIPAKRVTLDGDVVDNSNLMTGGQKNKSRGLGFKGVNKDQSKLATLEMEHLTIQKQLDRIESQIKQNQAEISRLYKLKISATNKTKDISENIAIAKSQIEQLTSTIRADEQELEEILQKIEGFTKQKHDLEKQIEEIDKTLTEKLNDEQKIQNQLDSSAESDLRKEIREAEQELKRQTKKANQIEIQLTKQNTRLSETISSGRIDAQNQLETKLKAISELSKSIAQISSELKEIEQDLRVLDEKIAEKSQILTILLKERKELTLELSEKKTQLGQLGNSIYPLQLQMNSLQVKSDEFHSNIQEWACHINPDVSISEEMLAISAQEHQKQLTTILVQKESLGAVNLRAIDKYKQINERFEDLMLKNEQIIQEREAILEFIEVLEGEKKKVFLNTFNAINQNFGFIFQKLSPGGEARLDLLNLEDPFADGVQILARPGEKEKCNVMALSGGERTLTIIALILGIQMHVPSPYYILDEIDAALDDVNATMVADMIKELSEKSQFVIITHRDVTMARVDHLLGVSNIEGVTSVINLSIRNVLKQLQTENENGEKQPAMAS